MRALFDASRLAQGLVDPRTRTGIYRYCDRIFEGLLRHRDVELRLCAPFALEATAKWFVERAPSGMPPLPHAPWQHRLSPPVVKLQEYINATIKDRRSSMRLSRRLGALGIAALRKPQERIDTETVKWTNIYHSAWFPIPSQINRARHLQPFLTVYDLVPIRMPELCLRGVPELFSRILKSARERTHFLTISHSTKDDLCEFLGIASERVTVTHLGADNKFFRGEQVHGEAVGGIIGNPEGPYILSVATLEPRKNLPMLVRAFARLVREEKIEDLSLVLVGGKGWAYDALFREASVDASIERRIVFTGFVPDDGLVALYRGALAFCYVPFYEGFGLPPLEAMQCGVPVVTSNTSSLPEVVGDAGLMVDPHDEDALCASLLDLYRNQSLREELSRRSLARAELFSWGKCVGETVKAYATSLEN